MNNNKLLEKMQQDETSKQIKKLIKLRRYNEAIRLTERYPLNLTIQLQRMIIAIEQGDYKKVNEIGNKQEFINDPGIQYQMMIMAIEQKDYEKAKEIGDRPKFINEAKIQLQRMIIAIEEGDYSKATKIGNRPKFINHASIQSQMSILATKTTDHKNDVVEEDIKNDVETQFHSLRTEMGEENCKFLDQVKTKIYYNKIQNTDIEEVKQNTKITEKQKIYILLAIYEIEKNVSQARKIIKEYKSNNQELADDKSLNIIMQRIESKKKAIFDWGFYDNLLNWQIDEELEEKYKHETNEQNIHKIQLRKEFVPKSKSILKENSTVHVNPKNMTTIKNIEKPKGQEKRILNDDLKQQKEINNFEKVIKYLTEKRKEIYVKMQSINSEIQKKGIIQWDKMDLLIEKTKQNKENKEYINRLYEKISRIEEKELLDKSEDENER